MAEFRAAMATERDYSHRSTVQKLGVAPEQRVEITGDVGPGLRKNVQEAIGQFGDLVGRANQAYSEAESKIKSMF